jgi:hypothetical protein
MEQNNGLPPIVDLPKDTDVPSPNIDLKKLAEEMTDLDQKALMIQCFRMLQELIGFTRSVQAVIDSMGDNPMMRAMGMGIMPPNMPGGPTGRPRRP